VLWKEIGEKSHKRRVKRGVRTRWKGNAPEATIVEGIDRNAITKGERGDVEKNKKAGEGRILGSIEINKKKVL